MILFAPLKRESSANCRKDTEASFNTGISACEKGGAWRDALLLLQMMSHVQMQLSSMWSWQGRTWNKDETDR